MPKRFWPTALSAVLMVWPGPQGVADTVFQSENSIRKAAEQFILDHLQDNQPGQPSIEVGRLDARLRLPACEKELEAFLPPGGKIIGGTTVGVRCPGSKPWSLYVPVKVAMYAKVVVASRSLPRGLRLSPRDLVLEERDITALPQGYLTDQRQAQGQLLKRPLAGGAPLVPAALEAPPVVRRGEKITVVARSAGGVEIRMAGTALSNGAAGERIRVRNLSSKRIVEGTVAETGVVEVNL